MHSNTDSQARTDNNKQVDSSGVLKPNPNENQRRRHPDVYSYERAQRLPQEWSKPPGASHLPARHTASGTVVTTDWETFEAVQPSIAAKPTSSSATNNAQTEIRPGIVGVRLEEISRRRDLCD
ncbi:hypothetical protein MLD38_015657 [Melastoma candidum]|nr:hypothetical protein MLD38_015657 [Melastoma candidum]